MFRYYGLPEDIVSDRGPQFTSRVWTAFFHLINRLQAITLRQMAKQNVLTKKSLSSSVCTVSRTNLIGAASSPGQNMHKIFKALHEVNTLSVCFGVSTSCFLGLVSRLRYLLWMIGSVGVRPYGIRLMCIYNGT